MIRVELEGRDWIELEENPLHVRFVGCDELIQRLQAMKAAHGPNPAQWPLPTGKDHVSILIRELVLKASGQWQFPYAHEELCHCRSVKTKTVDAAIVSGAHDTDTVSRWTSASTACGTCRADVQRIIDYRLRGQSP
ncbi:MAG: (2Fe-2S)-binding protein [Bdellovibrionaceae bacterium]|nr:(2Fe-2S)-binding protein [Pseudobdellovibrionaceae bacterium]